MSPQRTLGRDNLTAGRESTLANAAESETLPSRLGYGLLLLFLVASPWFFSGFWLVNHDYFPQLAFLAGTAGASLLLATAGLWRGKFQLLDWLLLGFIAWCALSLISTVYLHDSLVELTRITGIAAWFFVARAYLFQPGGRDRLPALTVSIVVGVGIEAAYAAVNYVTTRDPRQFGTYVSPNLFANAVAMGLPFALVLPIIFRRQFGRTALILGGVAVLILMGGLIVTSSKGGLLSAALGLMVTTIAISRARPGAVGSALRRYWPFLAVGLVVFGLVALKTVVPRLQNSFSGSDYSSLFRVYTWKATWLMALAKPLLGHGLGTFSVAFPEFAIASYTKHAHEVWLQLAAECGLPAMLLFAATFLVALASGWRQLKSENWPYAAAALGAVVAFAVHGLSDSGWGVTSIAVFLMVCLAILGGTGETATIPEATSRLSYSWVAMSLVALGGVMFSKGALNGEDSITESEHLMKVSAPTMALTEAQRAVDADPLSSRTTNQVAFVTAATGDVQKAIPYYKHAVELAPTRSSNWRNLALASDQLGDPAAAEKYFAEALRLDSNNTKLLKERADWRLAHDDPRGYDDLKRIVWLWDQPYGLYAPTPEFRNMDFTNSALILLPRLVKSGQTALARHLVEKAEADLVEAQRHDASNKQMAAVLGDDFSLDIPQNLPILVAQIEEWRQKLGMPAPNKS